MDDSDSDFDFDRDSRFDRKSFAVDGRGSATKLAPAPATQTKTPRAIPSYDDLISQARMLCPKSKPPFAEKRHGIEDGDLLEVVLAGADGKFPGSSPSVPREVFTARGWDEKHYFWILDRGVEKFIMRSSEGAYRRCLGINENMRAICEKNIFAYPIPDPSSRPSSPTVPNSDLDIPEHFMDQSPFKATTSRKRRLSHNQGSDSGRKPSAPLRPFPQDSTNQEIVEKDRLYYDEKNKRPPYVKKTTVQSQFVAMLADQNERRTKQQLEVNARQWSDGLQYWVADVDGHERIVDKCIGGGGGYTLRLWLGYEKHEQGIIGPIVGFPSLQSERDHSGQFARKLGRHSEPSIQRQTDGLSRASSVPHTRRTRNRLRVGRTKRHSTQVDNEARSPAGNFGKSPGTIGHNGSPLAGQTPSGVVSRTPKVNGNKRSTIPPLSASEPPAIESANGVPSIIPVPPPTNAGVSSEELLDMHDIDDQLKQAGVA
ncbi:MAG: hypothetical protein Q9171_002837 [Xanthocarpia ochracea]